MEKIKCPFCGEEIASDSKFCTSCGRSLEDANNATNETSNIFAASPKDDGWIKKWAGRDLTFKIAFTLLFVVCLTCYIIFKKKYDYALDHYDYYTIDEKIAFASCSIVFLYGFIFFGIFALYVDLRFRVTVASIDGYNVVVASGFYDRLIVEDELQYKRVNASGGLFAKRYLNDLEGRLPNNKKIWASVNSFFGRAEIGIGEPKNNH